MTNLISFVIYLTLCFILISLILIQKKVIEIRYVNYLFLLLKKENIELKKDQLVCLFLTFNNKHNISLINTISEKYSMYDIIIFFEGPEWQMKSLSKKINYPIILDKEKKIGSHLNIFEYPYLLIIDTNIKLKYKRDINYDV